MMMGNKEPITVTMHMSAGGSNSAVYMHLANTSATADALIGASTDVAEVVELHTVINEQGVMKMRPVPQIDLPANGTQQLKPGGFHVMLLGITQDLKEGDTIDLTLTFEQAGDVTITAPVMMIPPDVTDEPFLTYEHITITNPWVRAAVLTQETAPMTNSMEH